MRLTPGKTKMNENERKALRFLMTCTSKAGIREIQDGAELPVTNGDDTSTARNAMRRLLPGGWVEQPERGFYIMSALGRAALSKSTPAAPEPKVPKWRYLVRQEPAHRDALAAQLTACGLEGWELVGWNVGLLIYKQPA